MLLQQNGFTPKNDAKTTIREAESPVAAPMWSGSNTKWSWVLVQDWSKILMYDEIKYFCIFLLCLLRVTVGATAVGEEVR